MSRRIALPGADELFRSTGDPSRTPAAEAEPDLDGLPPTLAPAGWAGRPELAVEPVTLPEQDPAVHDGLDEAASALRSVTRRRPRAVSDRRPSGRERHEEKITVYVSAEELMDLEHARLTLRGDFGLIADRGRVVREALAVVLADLEAKGDASILVRRLRGR
jgi:hypothetical protein